MDTQYVLIVVQKPDQKNDKEWAGWLKFQQSIPEIPRFDEALAENVWVLGLHAGLALAVALLNSATENKLEYRVWFLSEPPQWVFSHPENLLAKIEKRMRQRQGHAPEPPEE